MEEKNNNQVFFTKRVYNLVIVDFVGNSQSHSYRNIIIGMTGSFREEKKCDDLEGYREGYFFPDSAFTLDNNEFDAEFPIYFQAVKLKKIKQ